VGAGVARLPLHRDGSRHCVWSANVRQPQKIVATDLSKLDEQARATVERLIDLIFDVLPDVPHERKWGRPTFTRERDWHHWICAVSATKNAVKLVIHKGALLADPRSVMEGEGRYSRAIAFRSPEQIDADVLAPILREAAVRQKGNVMKAILRAGSAVSFYTRREADQRQRVAAHASTTHAGRRQSVPLA
jgi:hypothetical protein